ncbi:MAG: transcription termination factor NusA [bacterium]|nr:transcription termination factor NusA [bacterium]
MQTTALLSAIRQLAYEKGIPQEKLIEILKEAISNSYKKKYKTTPEVQILIFKDNIKILIQKEVVKEPENNPLKISLKKALKINKQIKEGEKIFVEIDEDDFGRTEALIAKQLLIQKIRELETKLSLEELQSNLKNILQGTIRKRDEKGFVLVEFEKSIGILPPNLQTKGEGYFTGKKMKFLIVNVSIEKGTVLGILSRKSPLLVKRLLEKEYNEIADGNIEILDIARQAGYKTKVLVKSKIPSLDPISTILGPKNYRIQPIINELNGERIDIIVYSDDPKTLIIRSLGNVRILNIELDNANKIAKIIVPDEQLSQTIGKEGANAKLAASITKWKIDIKPESYLRKRSQEEQKIVFEGSVEEEENVNIKEMDWKLIGNLGKNN